MIKKLEILRKKLRKNNFALMSSSKTYETITQTFKYA